MIDYGCEGMAEGREGAFVFVCLEALSQTHCHILRPAEYVIELEQPVSHQAAFFLAILSCMRSTSNEWILFDDLCQDDLYAI